MNNFAKNLKKVIKYKEFTQKKLCELCGISENALTNYLSGEKERMPKLDILLKITQALDVSIDWLMYNNDDNSFPDKLHNNQINIKSNKLQKTNTEVPAMPGISADEREAIRLLRENPELYKLNQAYAKHKKKGKDAIESFVDGLQINLSLQNSI